MRTLYAATLGFASKDVVRATDLISGWIHGWYKRRGISFEPPSNADSESCESSPQDGHNFRLRVRSPKSAPKDHLLEIDWSYPDDYDKTVAWKISIQMAQDEFGATLVLRLGLVGAEYLIRPVNVKLGPPRIAQDLTQLPSATIAGYPYTSIPETVRAESVDTLCASLRDPARPYPIVIVSRDLITERPIVDVDRVAAGVAGLMKVYELADKWAAYRLTDELGKTLSCYGGAVRIYWPKMSLSGTDTKHYAWMPSQLRSLSDPDEFISQLFRLGADASAYRFFEPPAIAQTKSTIEREEREERRSQASNDADVLLEELIKTEDELSALESRAKTLEAENATLQQNLAALLGSAAASHINENQASGSESDEGAEPSDVYEAVVLAKEKCQHLVFLNSAEESAKDSPFRTPSRALQALQAVDEVASHWAESLSLGRSAGSFKQLFRERGFEYKDDISQTSRGKWGREYEARYGDQTVDIAPHITIGAKQADTCLSVHMYWDKHEKVAVIAHVGRHKTNTKT